MKPVYFIAPALLALALSACGRSNIKAEDDPGPAPATQFDASAGEAGELYNTARDSLERGQYSTAILEYESLEAAYPFGDHAEQARLDVAYAYYQQEELDNALATLERYLTLYPQSDQLDYALYMKGLVNFSRGKTIFESFVPRKLDQLDQVWLREAMTDFSTLARRFPESKFVEDANRRSSLILDQMALHELNTAMFYFEQAAMVAAINRVNYMLEQYPDSNSDAEGLALIVRSHRALGNSKSADEALALLRSKHPDFNGI